MTTYLVHIDNERRLLEYLQRNNILFNRLDNKTLHIELPNIEHLPIFTFSYGFILWAKEFYSSGLSSKIVAAEVFGLKTRKEKERVILNETLNKNYLKIKFVENKTEEESKVKTTKGKAKLTLVYEVDPDIVGLKRFYQFKDRFGPSYKLIEGSLVYKETKIVTKVERKKF